MEYRSERGNFEHMKGTGNPLRLQVGDQVELGWEMKLKEVIIQTHQWIEKIQVSRQGIYIGKYIYWIFSTGSPPIKILFLGETPQFMASKGMKYWG